MKRIDVDDNIFIQMTQAEAEQNCKLGQGGSCCAFLTMRGGMGFVCCRVTPLPVEITERLKAGLMNAKGIGGWSGCYWEEKLH